MSTSSFGQDGGAARGAVHAARIASLRALMREKGYDAVALTGSDPHGSEYPADRWKQVAWLSGFTGEAGDVVVTADHAGLWTDSRYFIQAVRELEGSGVELHRTRVPGAVPIPAWLAAQDFHPLAPDRPVTVAIDGLCWSRAAVDALRGAFARSVRIVDVPDLMDRLWEDRPGVPVSPVMTLGEDLVGESREAKVVWLRKFLMEKGCDAILLTVLDEIAWLLNVRGSDVAYNPVVISYLLVTMDEVDWFVRKGAVPPDAETEDSFYELRADGVRILDYDAVTVALADLPDEVGSLYADPATLNYSICAVLSAPDFRPAVLWGPSPVGLRKAVKNAVEVAGFREAHVEDGVAMERFLYWIGTALAEGYRIDEWEAAQQLEAYRSEIPGYRGGSFETISAYGPGAALPHYHTPSEGSAVLELHGLYLVDSGGQYLFGTTDITRTVPLGPCTPLEREDYTLVLKGHIALSRAVFPQGTAGCQLDVLARQPLWSARRDFGHGTGHGVGFFLCVHEGPQDIRQNFNAQPLLGGMVTSDEPGIYREGLHGVRHENLLLCVPAGETEFGSWLTFEPLTLCHFDTSVLEPALLTPDERAWLNAYQADVYEKLSPKLPSEIALWLREKTRPI